MKIDFSPIYNSALVNGIKKIYGAFMGWRVSSLGKNVKRHIPRDYHVPRQFGKNCIPNSIRAILIELRSKYGVAIDDKLFNKYFYRFSLRRNSNSMIEEAMKETGVSSLFVAPEGSLINSLKANNVEIAIAVQSSTHHAYPIIKVNKDGQDHYMTINQQGTQLAKARYKELVDANDVHYYAIRPTSPDHSRSDSASI